jgi:DNA-binding CsgD family transcriptional regulator
VSQITHGSHICAFYETKDDLIELVLPFFEWGSRCGDACVWALPETVSSDEPALHARDVIARAGVELHPGRSLYLQHSQFARDRVTAFWNHKTQRAIDAGRPGLCASGDAYWLNESEWESFLDYENYLTESIADRPISLLCTYPMSVCRVGDIFDVACAHHTAIAKRGREWQIIKGWGASQATAARPPKRDEALNAATCIRSLSQRERQVLTALMEGRNTKGIAYDLGISVRTVEVHRYRMLDRLSVRTSAEAVRLMTLASLIMQV